jgi:hypothetical protein
MQRGWRDDADGPKSGKEWSMRCAYFGTRLLEITSNAQAYFNPNGNAQSTPHHNWRFEMAHNPYTTRSRKGPVVFGVLAVLALIVFLVFAGTNSIPVDNTGAPGVDTGASEPLQVPEPDIAPLPGSEIPPSGG